MVLVSTSTLSSTLVLIDSAVQGYQSLISNIAPGTTVVVVDTATDGIAQITNLLAGCSQIKNLHIVSHGSPGELCLGASCLNLANLKQYSQQIRAWAKSLSADAELWLYGCNVAAGEIGKTFVESIANLTGASVAASSTPTGSTELGGNWQFEFQTGRIQSTLPFNSTALVAYPFVLGTLDWLDIDWPAGLLGTKTYSNLNNTGVDITITTAADPNVTFVPVGGEATPNDIAYLKGGKILPPEAFHFTIDPTQKGNGVTLTVTFNQPLNNVSFEIFDIDKAGSWQDQVVVTGVNGVTTVMPILTPLPSVTPSYSITNNVLLGASSALDLDVTDSARGTAGVRFNSTITGFSIVFNDGPAAASDPSQHGIALLSNITFDDPGVIVSPISGNTTEAGGTATFNVVLSSAPTQDVTINLTSSDLTEGTVPASITFTPANWNTPQTVTVKGEDDLVVDGNINYTIVTSITSTDPLYSTINPVDVSVINTDNDVATPGVAITPTSLTTTEAGGTGSFDVVLTAQPTADVIITLTGLDTTEGTLSTTKLTFTATNWDQAQTVTVTGKDDSIDDGDIVYTINTDASSSDKNYNNIAVVDVTVTNTDNDVPVIGTPGFTISSISGNTTEAGGTATFTVRLNSQPTANVVVSLNSSDTTEGTVPNAITFTSTNWDTPQAVTVTGVDDPIVDGNIPYTILTSVSTSDLEYQAINPDDVPVINLDNDQNTSPPITPPPITPPPITPPPITPPPITPPATNNNPPDVPTPPDASTPPVCLPGVTLRGNRQKNLLDGTFRGDWLAGLNGNDVLHGYGCNDRVVGGRGKDRLFGDEGHDIVMGGVGDDRLFGNDGNDILMGGRGKDRLRGGANDDVLRGQQKRDLLNGGQGNDQLWGGLGWDLLRGGQGDDLLKGGRGQDRLMAGRDNDTMDGGLNRDRLNGFAGDDVLFGRRGNDLLRGHRGNDILNGGRGRDRMRGHQGKDILRGGAGRDWLNGGLGGDILVGGGRADVLTGGAGRDQYVYRSLRERGDRIVGFNPVQDVINLSRLVTQPAFQGTKTIADLITLTQTGIDTRIQVDVNGKEPGGLQTLATLVNVATTSLSNRNFLI